MKWGESAASYSLLNSEQFARSVAKIGMVMGLAVAVGAAAAVGALVPAALVGSTAAAIFPYAGLVSYTTGVASIGFGAAALATVVGIIIVAVVIAVMQGMIVINAAELPGQLAELIVDARTDAPDVDELIDTTDGMTTLFALFVVATLPEPRDEYCDNSSTIPENIKHGGFFVNLSWRPCLNRTGIPEATPYDPRFLIKEDGETTGTLSPTITFQDHAATTATARLHDGWFILEPTGSYDEQTLAIEYIDWNGKKQQAWLLGNPDASQVFVSLDVTNDLTEGLEDCLDDGLCSESESLEYLSPDGKKMSASVEQWKPAVGAPSYDATPVELSPTSYDANGFAPTDATGEVSYEWRFEKAPCTKPCVLLKGPLAPPDYGDPVSGAEVTHTWPYPGPFTVALTATDAEGRTATTSFEVQVENVPPRILQLVPDCPQNAAGNPVPGPECLSRTGSTATPRKLRGSFVDGQFDLRVNINWGDGSGVADCIPAAETEPLPAFPGCPETPGNGLELKPTGVGDDRFFEFEASHVYAEPGVYHGTMWVSDGVGATAEPFTMTIEDPTDVLVTTNTADGVVRIAETDATSHTIEVRLASQPSSDIIVRRHDRQPPGSGGRWGQHQHCQLHLAHVHPRQLGPTPDGHGARRRRQLRRERPASDGRRRRGPQGRGPPQRRRPGRFVRTAPAGGDRRQRPGRPGVVTDVAGPDRGRAGRHRQRRALQHPQEGRRRRPHRDHERAVHGVARHRSPTSSTTHPAPSR